MIPRALPRLITDALTHGWKVRLDSMVGLASVSAEFVNPSPLSASYKAVVEIEWMDGRKVESTINGTPTPYAQCTKLIRNPEGA